MSLTATTPRSGKLLVSSSIVLVIVALLTHFLFGTKSQTVEAQIAVLYATSCLGGWKNPDLVTGAPEVFGNPDASYTQENSAVLKNTQTQLFCGGFSGTIPENVDRTKIMLRFSWQSEMNATDTSSSKEDQSDRRIKEETEERDLSTTTENTSTSSEPRVEKEPIQEDPAVVPEEVIEIKEIVEPPSEEAVSWWPFIPTVNAQEESTTMEEVVLEDNVSATDFEATNEEVRVLDGVMLEEEDVASSTASTSLAATQQERDVVSTSTASSTTDTDPVWLNGVTDADKDGALFEVLFTTDNEEWHVLGYVPRINNDIQFELPLDMFDSVEDFSQLQISLKTLERFDDTPTIYLDSIWIEVSYVDAGQDPLSPPGSLAGDVVVRRVSTEEGSLVTVFRNTSLETLSNILSTQASSTVASVGTTTASTTPTIETVSIATTSLYANASSTVVLFEADIPRETKDALRATPRVLVELWFHNRLTDSWTRVADNSIIATEPYAVMFDKKVFWFGPDMKSLWMFDALSGGYTSQSFNAGEPVAVEFVHSSSELYHMKFDQTQQQLVPLKKEVTALE